MVTPDIPNLTDLRLRDGLDAPEASRSPRRAGALFSGRRTETGAGEAASDGDVTGAGAGAGAGAGDVADAGEVVVKVWDEFPADERKRFVGQWRIAGILDGHPGIAEVHDGGDDGDRVWLVRDWVDGASLQQALRGPAPATSDAVRRLTDQHLDVARVVAYAHRNGVVHGALKPTNVFVVANERAVITDFALPGLTAHGAPDRDDPAIAPWLAPELVAGGRPTPASDVYSLAAMLQAALTGTQPKPRDGEEGILDTTRLRNLPGLGSQLVPLIDAALSPNPQRRPPNAGVFAEALARLVAVDVPIESQPTAPMFDPRPQPNTSTTDPLSADSNAEVSIPHASDRRRARRGAVLAGVGLLAAVAFVAFAWSFLTDLTRSDDHSPVETAAPPTASTPVSTVAADDTPATDAATSRTSASATVATQEPTSPEPASAPRADADLTSEDLASEDLASADLARDDASAEEAPAEQEADADTALAQPGPAASASTSAASASAAQPAPTVRPEPTVRPAPTIAPRPTLAPTPPPAEPVPTLASTQQPILPPTAVPSAPNVSEVAGTQELAYEGSRFSAALPTGWTPVSENRDVGYGYRTRFKGPDGAFLYIDLTPPTHHDGSETIEQSARRIAAQTSTAGPVLKLTLEDKTTWWFEYTGNDGSARIDVFFAIGDTGYAVVGGSHDDPAEAYEALIGFVQTLRQV